MNEAQRFLREQREPVMEIIGQLGFWFDGETLYIAILLDRSGEIVKRARRARAARAEAAC